MSRARAIADLVALLRALGHPSALVGGLAVSIRARVRFTDDIDLAVAVASDREAEELAFAVQRRGFVLASVIEQEARSVVATLRFRGPLGEAGPGVNLLLASSGIEPEIVAAATRLALEAGISVPVAVVPHLIAMKILSVRDGREQDASDLRALFAVAKEDDLRTARQALALIEERGFARGKDLARELDRYLG